MNKKELEMKIEKIPELKNPKPELEQHTTPSWIAAELLWNLKLQGKLQNKITIDLGSGTGRLCIGSILAGAKECVSIEIDPEQIELQKEIIQEKTLDDNIHIIRGDARNTPLRKMDSSITLMNPPFGTVKKGIDREFLLEAIRISPFVISFHLSNPKTVKYLSRIAREKHYNPTILNTYYMELKQVFSYHTSKIKRVPVDLILYTREE